MNPFAKNIFIWQNRLRTDYSQRSRYGSGYAHSSYKSSEIKLQITVYFLHGKVSINLHTQRSILCILDVCVCVWEFWTDSLWSWLNGCEYFCMRRDTSSSSSNWMIGGRSVGFLISRSPRWETVSNLCMINETRLGLAEPTKSTLKQRNQMHKFAKLSPSGHDEKWPEIN